MKITDTFIAEHRAFSQILDEIEKAIPTLATVREGQLLGKIMEGFLNCHGADEDNLLYPAVQQMDLEQKEAVAMVAEHLELESQINNIKKAGTLAETKAALEKLCNSTRIHFRNEETHVFPLAEKCLTTQSLERLQPMA